MARRMHPPVLILECPGSEREGTHYWATINPRWAGLGKEPREVKWCPSHTIARRNSVRKAIMAERVHRSEKWDKLPLPQTRRCCNPDPDPDHHEPGAIMPSILFYKRTHAPRKNGTRAAALDSRCMMCRRAESAETRRRNALSVST